MYTVIISTWYDGYKWYNRNVYTEVQGATFQQRNLATESAHNPHPRVVSFSLPRLECQTEQNAPKKSNVGITMINLNHLFGNFSYQLTIYDIYIWLFWGMLYCCHTHIQTQVLLVERWHVPHRSIGCDARMPQLVRSPLFGRSAPACWKVLRPGENVENDEPWAGTVQILRQPHGPMEWLWLGHGWLLAGFLCYCTVGKYESPNCSNLADLRQRMLMCWRRWVDPFYWQMDELWSARRFGGLGSGLGGRVLWSRSGTWSKNYPSLV